MRTLYEAGKLANAVHEMQRLNIDILGVSEVRWTGSGQCSTNKYTMYYSGPTDTTHQNGVGIIVSESMNRSVRNFLPYSDRIALLQLQTRPIKVNIIQAYAPTSDKSDEEIEEFYEHLKTVIDITKKNEVNIIMGDFNAKIGRGEAGEHVGKFGLGVRNPRGDRLIQFCQEQDLVVMNTCFELPPRRLYTWKSPQDTTRNTVRNQIDFIMVSRRFRNSFKSVKTYPGADIGSDHNPVVGTIKLRLKSIPKKKNTNSIDISIIRDNQVCKEIQNEIETGLKELGSRISFTEENTSIEEAWNGVKQICATSGGKHLRRSGRVRKQQWMTDEILDLMDERRRYKNKDHTKYRQLQQKIRKAICRAKEGWMAERCSEMEELQRKHDNFGLHKKIGEITGRRSKQIHGILLDNNNKIITDINDKLNTWRTYIETLFADDRTTGEQTYTYNTGPEIMKEEVRHSIKLAKNGKAAGPDEVYADLLKLLNDEGVDMITKLFNAIYRTGFIPPDWLKSTFIAIPKKTNARRCEDYRTISLMSHACKIFLKIIHSRIYKKCEELISDTQFGFRNGLGTRDALFAMQVLMQRCLDVNVDVYTCFVDFEKAFDQIRHDKLMSILKSLNLDDRDVRIIANLYWNQSANIRIEGSLSESIQIKRGVRQGCILSPLLFNIYSEAILNEALLNLSDKGININGERVNNIRYADDTVLIAENIADLQMLLEAINAACNSYGLKINVKKTKFMVVSKEQNIQAHPLHLNNEAIEQVHQFKYLGCYLTEQGSCTEEVSIRIEQARSAFIKIKKLVCDRNLSINLRIRLVQCYVFPVLLYGIEGWTLNKAQCKKLEAFEMWTYRRMLKISWMERITNNEVMTRLNKDVEIMLTIKRRKLEYLGHIMRSEKYQLLQVIMEGKIIGSRSRGRRKTSWLKNLRDWYGMSSRELFRAAVSKVIIAMMIANLR